MSIIRKRSKVFEISKDIVGKVIGEFMCDFVLDIRPPYGGKTEGTCLEAKELYTYAGAKPLLYGWHISNLEIYETPENLSTFGMSRPPQSWCYVEGKG